MATQDWCERAAGALALTRGSVIAAVSLGVLGPRGRVLKLEATGAAGTDPAGRAIDPDAIHPEHENTLDWWLTGDEPEPVRGVALLRQLPALATWRAGRVGNRWIALGALDLLVGFWPAGGRTGGRGVIVELATTASEQPFIRADLAVVQGVIPLLAHRAVLAFGNEPSSTANRLTPREQQVLDQLALGKSVREIAEELARSPHTVHDHVKSLHRKLNASSRGELVARALGHVASTWDGADGLPAPVHTSERVTDHLRARPTIRKLASA
ncbi:MAG: helix-turn-helix transcriptional regulator [Planctomycetota bacterium]